MQPEDEDLPVSPTASPPSADLEHDLHELLGRADADDSTQQRVSVLLDTVVGIAADLSVDSVLQSIVEAASRLADAKYVALGVIGSDRDRRLRAFITHGLTAQEREAIGELPHGRGLLGLIIDEPRAVRTAEIGQHPRSFGFPAHHPPMNTFLGVPIRTRGKVFGNLYLTEKAGGAEFSEIDEAIVTALAAAAGVVIENARLYEEAAHREQWLQATAEITTALLGNLGNDQALQLICDRARELSEADVASILLRSPRDELRTGAVSGSNGDLSDVPVPLDASLAGAVVHTGDSLVVEDVHRDPRGSGELVAPGWPEVGPAVLVPMQTPDGIDGVLLLGWTRDRISAFFDVDVQQVQQFAVQAALALQVARAREDKARLALFEDRDRIGRDLHDLVIQRLFAIGLSLESTSQLVHEEQASARVAAAVDDIDTTIKDIRRSIFALSASEHTHDLHNDVAQVIKRAVPSLGFEPRLSTVGPLNSGISAVVAPHLLAVLAEALSNAARHAEATEVSVSVAVDREVRLVVQDNGRGIGSDRRSGMRNMQERAELLGGGLDVVSAPGHGTTLTWSVPVATKGQPIPG